jgi:hypothetical protein
MVYPRAIFGIRNVNPLVIITKWKAKENFFSPPLFLYSTGSYMITDISHLSKIFYRRSYILKKEASDSSKMLVLMNYITHNFIQNTIIM